VHRPLGLDDLSELFFLFFSEKPYAVIILSTVRHRPRRAGSDFSIEDSQAVAQRHERPVVTKRRGRPLFLVPRSRENILNLFWSQLFCGMRTEPLLKAGKARDVSLVRPLVPFGISERVVKQLAEFD